MTKEEKQLVLIDLCARLPYGVIFNYCSEVGCDYKLTKISNNSLDEFPIEDCKPYLRPMSSMNEEEKGIFQDFIYPVRNDPVSMIDWLNEHHFDYRGFIEKGLALEAPEGMYK